MRFAARHENRDSAGLGKETDRKMMSAVCVALTIVFTVYGQLVLKWQFSGKQLPENGIEKLTFLLMQLLNPWVFSGFAAAFAASLCWMAAMTKLKLSQTYPFMSLAFVLVMILSWPLFGETPTTPRTLGTIIVLIGLIVISR